MAFTLFKDELSYGNDDTPAALLWQQFLPFRAGKTALL
jgi:hypothetical protein